MPPPASVPVTTLEEFTAVVAGMVQDARALDALPLWFRGVGDLGRHKLEPSLFRHPARLASPDLLLLESKMLSRFRQRSLPFLDPSRQRLDAWETLFLMQHYGVPTRLLDWSENSLIALFFALTSAPRDATWAVTADAAVWVLNPRLWNEASLHTLKHGRRISDPADGNIVSYTPGEYRTSGGGFDDAVAIYGTHNSPRIVAQRGTFAMFGRSLTPMEGQATDPRYHASSLQAIVIPQADVQSLLDMVLDAGYTDSMVYPDLEGLAKELKRHFGFRQ